MAELGDIARAGAAPKEGQQIAAAFALAFLFHLVFGLWLQSRSHDLTPLPILSVVDVKLLPSFKDESETKENLAQQLPVQDIVSPAAVKPTSPIEPLTSVEPEIVPQLTPPPATAIIPPTILNNEAGSAAGQFPTAREDKAYVPSQWALEPPLKTERREGMGLVEDMDCLRALSADCAGLRKEVFAEFELTETEKVWTEKRADTGMPSEFFGLSEREIRLKIGSHIAGENGQVLIPGLLKIDGPLWDTLHGVKKHCTYIKGVKKCPDSQSSARDKKYYIPPTQ